MRGDLPLHLAASEEATVEVVRALLEAHPDGAKEREDKYGDLPLHWAASEEATVVVAQELLEAQQEVPTWAKPPLRLGTLQEQPTTTDNSA